MQQTFIFSGALRSYIDNIADVSSSHDDRYRSLFFSLLQQRTTDILIYPTSSKLDKAFSVYMVWSWLYFACCYIYSIDIILTGGDVI